MSKRIICLLLALTMTLSIFTGCGTSIDEEPSTTTASTEAGDSTGTDSTDSTGDSTGTGDSSSSSASGSMAEIIANWSYDFDYSFIEENGIEYVWENIDEDTRMNLGEMMNAIREGQIYCSFTVGFPSDEKQQFLELVTSCCTFYTWIGTSFSAAVNNETGMVSGITISYRGIEYETDIQPLMDDLEAVLDEVIAAMPDGTEFEKLKYLHDYLVLNCDYSDTAGTSPFSAYGALVEGYATCQGYADAMHLLLARAGFETMFVLGVGSNSSVTHKWNYVKCEDGHWYIIDSTWDDPEDIEDLNFVGYCYFLISDEEILKDHESKAESSYYETPYADSMDLNFFNVMGYCASTEDEAATLLNTQATTIIDSTRRNFYIKFDSADQMREVYELLRDNGEIAAAIEAANAAAGTSYQTGSWSRTFNDELGILTITLKES